MWFGLSPKHQIFYHNNEIHWLNSFWMKERNRKARKKGKCRNAFHVTQEFMQKFQSFSSCGFEHGCSDYIDYLSSAWMSLFEKKGNLSHATTISANKTTANGYECFVQIADGWRRSWKWTLTLFVKMMYSKWKRLLTLSLFPAELITFLSSSDLINDIELHLNLKQKRKLNNKSSRFVSIINRREEKHSNL